MAASLRSTRSIEVADASDRFRVTPSPIDGEGATSVVADHDNILGDIQAPEQRLKEPPMLEKSVASRVRALDLFRVAHADEIGRDAPSVGSNYGQDIPPEIGGATVSPASSSNAHKLPTAVASSM